jgi:hypothetical protein
MIKMFRIRDDPLGLRNIKYVLHKIFTEIYSIELIIQLRYLLKHIDELQY